MYKIKLLIGLFVLSSNFFFSQSQLWKRFVNWNDATSLVSENDSTIWVGTKVGLVKWNIKNNTYKTFGLEDGMRSVYINDLKFDHNGNLWAATNNGILKYDGNSFVIYNKSNSPFPKAPFTKIAIDSKDNVYCLIGEFVDNKVHQYGGLAALISNQWYVYLGNDYNFMYQPSAIILYNDTVYFNVSIDRQFDCKMLYFDGIELKKDTTWKFSTYIDNFTIDYEDSLWAATGRRLYKKRAHKWDEIIGENSGLGTLWYCAWSNGYNGLWLGGSGYDLYYLNIAFSRQGIKYDSKLPAGLKQIWNNTLTEKFTDHISIGTDEQYFTSENGLFKYNNLGYKINYFNVPKDINDNTIYGIGISPQNEILIAESNVSQKYDGNFTILENTWNFYNNNFEYSSTGKLFTNHSSLLPNSYATGISFDGYGHLWAAYGNVYEYTLPSTQKTYTFEEMGINVPDGYSSPQFMNITADKFDNIWAVGWYGYTVMFDRTNWHIYKGNDIGVPFLSQDYVYADSKNRIWLCDNNSTPNFGIILYENNKWSVINFPELWRAHYVYQIAEDNYGNLWFASQSGLLKYDNAVWYIFNDVNSFLDQSWINAVNVDHRGNIWIGTAAGLYVYNPYGLDLNSDITHSSVDSLSVEAFGDGAKLKIHTSVPNHQVLYYQLQRGRNPYKFWTISSITPSDRQFQIIDSLNVIGDFLYRIREVDTQGRVYFSNYVSFHGLAPSVEITDFSAFPRKGFVYFRWKASSERFLSHFDLKREFKGTKELLAIVEPDAGNDGTYEIKGDSLKQDAGDYIYSINAVFADSSESNAIKLPLDLEIINNYFVSRNYPNPFNNQTSIDFMIPSKQMVIIKIYDLLGRLIYTPINKEFDFGYYTIKLDLSNYASGVYLINFQSAGYNKTEKMILMK